MDFDFSSFADMGMASEEKKEETKTEPKATHQMHQTGMEIQEPEEFKINSVTQDPMN